MSVVRERELVRTCPSVFFFGGGGLDSISASKLRPAASARQNPCIYIRMGGEGGTLVAPLLLVSNLIFLYLSPVDVSM